MEKEAHISREEFYKDRSFKACVVDAWKIFALGHRSFLKYILPHLLLFAIGGSLAVYLLLTVGGQNVLPMFVYKNLAPGIPAEYFARLFSPSWIMLLLLVVALLFGLAVCYAFKGRLYGQISAFAERGGLPVDGIKGFRQATLVSGVRVFVFDAVVFLPIWIVAGLLLLLAAKTTAWLLVPIVPLVAYALFVAFVARLFYMLERKDIWEALRFSLVRVTPVAGGYILVGLISLAIIVPLSAVALLPVGMLSAGYYEICMSMFYGDQPAVTAAFPIAFVAAAFCGIAIVSFLVALQTCAFALKMASTSVRLSNAAKG